MEAGRHSEHTEDLLQLQIQMQELNTELKSKKIQLRKHPRK